METCLHTCYSIPCYNSGLLWAHHDRLSTTFPKLSLFSSNCLRRFQGNIMERTKKATMVPYAYERGMFNGRYVPHQCHSYSECARKLLFLILSRTGGTQTFWSRALSSQRHASILGKQGTWKPIIWLSITTFFIELFVLFWLGASSLETLKFPADAWRYRYTDGFKLFGKVWFGISFKGSNSKTKCLTAGHNCLKSGRRNFLWILYWFTLIIRMRFINIGPSPWMLRILPWNIS